jgi:hypothetical protein
MLLAWVYCDRGSSSFPQLDTFVGTLQGSISSDIFFSLLLVHVLEASSDLLLSIERRISPLFFCWSSSLSLVNNMLTGDIPNAIYSLSNLCKFSIILAITRHLFDTVLTRWRPSHRFRFLATFEQHTFSYLESSIGNLTTL